MTEEKPSLGDANSYDDSDRDLSSIEKVREILFGGYVQDYTIRLKNLEERLEKRINNIEAESAKKFEALERAMIKEVKSLSAEAEKNRFERIESVAKLSERIQTLTGKLDTLGRQSAQEIAVLNVKLKEMIEKTDSEIISAKKYEQQERKALADQLQNRIKTIKDIFSKDISDISQDMVSLKKQVSETFKGATEDWLQKNTDIVTKLRREIFEKNENKIDRSTLANALSDIAKNLDEKLKARSS